MKRNLLYLAFLSLVLFIACEEESTPPPPSAVAAFTYEATNDQTAPTTVTFTNTSIEALTYAWDFGDGTTSTEENPVHEYTEPGNYEVSLTATNETSENTYTETLVIVDPFAGKSNAVYYGDGFEAKIFYKDVTEGAALQGFPSAGLNRPYSIAIDRDNEKVYVADYGAGQILRYDLDGSNIEVLLDFNDHPDFVSYPSGIILVGDKIMWGDDRIGVVKANLDGSNPEIVYASSADTAPEYPIGLAYDEANGEIYLVNDKLDFSGGLWKMNLDGTGMTQIIPDIDATAIDIDPVNGKLYYADYDVGIVRSNFDGTGAETIGLRGDKATNGIKVDVNAGKVYWSVKNSFEDGATPSGWVSQANLDGTGAIKFIDNVDPNGIGLLLYR